MAITLARIGLVLSAATCALGATGCQGVSLCDQEACAEACREAGCADGVCADDRCDCLSCASPDGDADSDADADREPTSEDTTATCRDGLDNDGDGLVDCDDPGCAAACAACDLVERGTVDCSDGVDDDCDGYVDCDDYDCFLDVALTSCGAHETSCRDGHDDDGDGDTDCDDRDCRWFPGRPCPCLPGGECDDATCSDGIDNDGNGFVDCDDWECGRNYNVSVCGW